MIPLRQVTGNSIGFRVAVAVEFRGGALSPICGLRAAGEGAQLWPYSMRNKLERYGRQQLHSLHAAATGGVRFYAPRAGATCS